MRVLIAPDKFKGSLTAAEAAAAIRAGVLDSRPDAEVVEMPIADGGEGTLEAAYRAGYEKQSTAVAGPLGTCVEAAWALRRDSSGATALIEASRASGLELMHKSPRNALHAQSYGVGQLITAALDAGAREVVVGLGGSAMTDGGMGAACALGLVVRDAAGDAVALGGGQLSAVASIDASGLDPRLAGIRLRLAVDVQNPLHGPDGAAHVFSPQKGADPAAVGLLDSGLRNWDSMLQLAGGRRINIPGAGAAGGFAAPFLAFTGAVCESGFALVAQLTGLERELPHCALVITGEGSLDAQSLAGKAPIALSRAAAGLGIPVVALAGRILVAPQELAVHGITAATQLLDLAGNASGVPDANDAMVNAARYLTHATAQLLAESGAQGLPPAISLR